MAIHVSGTGVDFDELVGSTQLPLLTKNVTVAKSTVLKRGAVLGKITASGSYQLVDASKSDGSQMATVILAEDVDATEADAVATVYTTGEFNREKLIVADGDTVDAHEDELRAAGIHLTSIK